MRSILALLVLAPACATESDAVTPNGTSILSWDLTRSDRLTIRNATTSDHQLIDFEHAMPEMSIVLGVELVTATVRYYEAGRLETRTAPIALELRVADNGGYLIDRAGCTGPHYELANNMLLTCDFAAMEPGSEAGFTVHARGDGSMTSSMVD